MKKLNRKLVPTVFVPILSGAILLYLVIKEDFAKIHQALNFSLNTDIVFLVVAGMFFGAAITNLAWFLLSGNEGPES